MKRYSMEWIDYEDAEMAEFDDGDYVRYAEAQAEIDDYRNIIYKVRMLLPSYAKEAVDDVLNKYRGK